jgi:hypothetical protein
MRTHLSRLVLGGIAAAALAVGIAGTAPQSAAAAPDEQYVTYWPTGLSGGWYYGGYGLDPVAYTPTISYGYSYSLPYRGGYVHHGYRHYYHGHRHWR